jgi:hypothetical protein
MLATIMEAQLSSILSSEREFHRSESGLIACSLRSVTSSGSSSIYSSSFHSASLFRYRSSIIGFLELVEVVLHLVVKLVCKVVIGDLVAAEGQIEIVWRADEFSMLAVEMVSDIDSAAYSGGFDERRYVSLCPTGTCSLAFRVVMSG